MRVEKPRRIHGVPANRHGTARAAVGGDIVEKGMAMTKYSHRFVETFDGMAAYGLDRQSDEHMVQLYLQKFSDDGLMDVILKRMSDDDLSEVFDVVSKMLSRYLTEPEYHDLFLKDDE